MKLSLNLIIGCILTGSVLLSSCGKYEEGPNISLASKKARIVRAWTFSKSIDGSSGAEFVCTVNCTVMELVKDGTILVNGANMPGLKWQFSDDKSKLEYVAGSTLISSIKIIRLTSKDLWLKDDDGDQEHYIAD